MKRKNSSEEIKGFFTGILLVIDLVDREIVQLLVIHIFLYEIRH